MPASPLPGIAVPPAASSSSRTKPLLIAGLVLGAVVVVGAAIASGNDGDNGGAPSADASGEPFDYGDSASLDLLWDDCEAGDYEACDSLWSDSAVGSEYERFGATCGDTTNEEEPGTCAEFFGEGSGVVDSYGDDPYLDSLWEDCEVGDDDACDLLYYESPAGSVYEYFGSTCGDTVNFGGSCTGA